MTVNVNEISWEHQEVGDQDREAYGHFVVATLREAHQVLSGSDLPDDDPELLFAVGGTLRFSEEVEENVLSPDTFAGAGIIEEFGEGWKMLLALAHLRNEANQRFGSDPERLVFVNEKGEDLDVSGWGPFSELLLACGLADIVREIRQKAEELGFLAKPIVIESEVEDSFF